MKVDGKALTAQRIAWAPDAPGRRPTRTLPAMRIRSRRRTASAVLLAGIATALLGACGGDDESAEDVPADDESAPAAPEDGEPVEDRPSCDALAGLPTAEVLEISYCADGETVEWHLKHPQFTCLDGQTLYVSEWGWGYSDGTWHANKPTEDDIRVCVVPTTLPQPSLPPILGVTPR